MWKHETHEIGSGTKLFITIELKVIRHEEREAQSFYADFSICSPPRAAPSRKLLVWSRRAPKVNLLTPRQELNSLPFLKSPKSSAHASGAWCHSQPLIPNPLWDFYFNITEWHILSARAWTAALMLHLTNPCAKRKVLSLTKPKGKIYKTKSLRNYITKIESSSIGTKAAVSISKDGKYYTTSTSKDRGECFKLLNKNFLPSSNL